jgi:hypothetical protein
MTLTINDDINESAYRWLAGEKSIDNVSVTIEVPQSALSSGKKGLALWGCACGGLSYGRRPYMGRGDKPQRHFGGNRLQRNAGRGHPRGWN